ncbi:MAG: hypothetical protein IPJ20_19430 [Flammeovirgaceae bacterium]|nr:hypothetical protein [Flammeovirgaceae bacterium]
MEKNSKHFPTPTVSPEPTYGAYRAQIYYAIKKASGYGIVLFLSAGLLIKRFGLSEKTIRNGISKFVNGKSRYYKTYKENGVLMLDYDEALPPTSNRKLRCLLILRLPMIY